MNRKLKTVPLKELFDSDQQKTAAFRIGIVVVAIVDMVVLSVFLWKMLY